MISEIPKRLAPKPEVIKLLLLRSGNRCAFPDCGSSIFNDDNILIGECCHIEAALSEGERFNPLQTNEERRSYKNILFLCHKHHVETNDITKYTVEALNKIKAEHENKFRETPFEINSNYIDQVIAGFEEIIQLSRENNETLKRIENSQKIIFETVSKNQINTAKEESEELGFEPFIPININYVGRNEELKILNQALLQYTTLQIGGLSGIGKSSFLAEAFKENNNCIWIDCAVVNSETVFLSISRFLHLRYNDVSLLNILKSPTTSNEQLVNITTKLLETHKVLLVLDGLNDKLPDFTNIIKQFNKYFKEARIVLSTTKSIDVETFFNPIYSLQLEGLDDSTSIQLVKLYGVNIDENNDLLLKIFKSVSGHPYILKLISILLQKVALEDLFNQLKSLSGEKINDYVKRRIFDLLNGEEQKLLINLAVIRTPFRIDAINYFSLQNNKSELFLGLIDKYLVVRHSERSNLYVIHELIRGYAFQLIPPDEYVAVNNTAYNYFTSLQGHQMIYEAAELIHHGLEAELTKEAEAICTKFLSNMLAAGYFNTALNYSITLELNTVTKNWAYIYYTQGRVYRFQDEWDIALKKYDYGLRICHDEELASVFKFEKASILANLSTENADEALCQQAIDIYTELSENTNQIIQVQALSTLGLMKVRAGEIREGILEIENALQKANAIEKPGNIIASMWQCLGDAYYKLGEYIKAIECFDQSFLEYDKIKDEIGMQIFDGLYHLYESLAWAYTKRELYGEAAKIFSFAADIAEKFGFFHKLEQSLFDYGYNTLLAGDFEKAAIILTRHFDLLNENDMLGDADLPFVYGNLMTSYWYNGDCLGAIELLGLYLVACAKDKMVPAVALAQQEDILPNSEVLSFFKKRIYLLILLAGKTFEDFKNWLNIVIEKRPDLAGPLTSFYQMPKKDET